MSEISKWAEIQMNHNFVPHTDLQVLNMVSALDASQIDNELNDSRKRQLEAGLDNDAIKRSQNGSANGVFHLKILVPSIAAGAIIGKGGETIAQLQKEAGARVKMSKATDFYPGTTERVCLISGSYEGILHIQYFIMEKIKEKPDPNAKMAIDFDHKQPAEREKQVKILVPNSTAGMIMGKGGSYIKQIKEQSAAYVQISQKSKDYALAERCITIIGEMENNRKACAMILMKIVEDPQSGSCLNVSYAEVTGPVPNFNPTGSPFANPNSIPNGIKNSSASFSSNSSLNSLSPSVVSSFHTSPNDSVRSNGGLALFPDLGFNGSQIHPSNAAQIFENIKLVLRENGYTETAIAEIIGAMTTLVSYGILGLRFDANAINEVPAMIGNLGMAMQNQVTSTCHMQASSLTSLGMYPPAATAIPAMNALANHVASSASLSSNVFGPIPHYTNGISGMVSNFNASTPTRPNERYIQPPEGTMYDTFQRTSPTLASPSAAALPVNNNSFGLGTNLSPTSSGLMKNPEQTVLDVTAEVEVRENKIGAVLGPHGKSLAEIQRISGTNILISKKGIFSPGTQNQNRMVTITGNPRAVETAQFLIQQQLNADDHQQLNEIVQQNALGVLN